MESGVSGYQQVWMSIRVLLSVLMVSSSNQHCRKDSDGQPLLLNNLLRVHS